MLASNEIAGIMEAEEDAGFVEEVVEVKDVVEEDDAEADDETLLDGAVTELTPIDAGVGADDRALEAIEDEIFGG